MNSTCVKNAPPWVVFHQGSRQSVIHFGRTRLTAASKSSNTQNVAGKPWKERKKKRTPSLIGDPTSRRFASDDVLFFAKIWEDVSFSPETNISHWKSNFKPVGFQMKFLFGVFFGPIFRGSNLLVVLFWGFGSKVMCFFKVKWYEGTLRNLGGLGDLLRMTSYPNWIGIMS